jgi:tetratricopeptide (TPR) repeat protein
MQMKGYWYLVSGLICVFLFALHTDVSAQKKNKKSEPTEQKTDPKPISTDMRQKAEMFHAEGEKYFILEDYAKAFVLYQRSLELDPQNATAYFKIAEIYLKSDELDKAAFNAERAIKMDPGNKFFYLLLAEIYTKQSKFADAASTYEQMIQKCENTNEYLFELAALYIYQDNIKEALNIYTKIEDYFGINEQVTAQKQKLHLKQSNLEKAIEEGEKLINAFPGEPRFVLMMVDILISNNLTDRAIPYLEELLISDPENSRALLILADIYRKKGDSEKSNIYLNKAFEKSDLDIEPKIQVLAGFMQKLPNTDIEALTKNLGAKIIIAHPDDYAAYEINGDLSIKLSDDSNAINYYKKAIELGSPNFNTWQAVLQLQMKAGNYKAAIADGEKALELFPNQAGICWFLGTAYLVEKDYESAVEVLEQGKKLSGVNEELKSYFNAQLGDTYNNLKNYKKSDESYEAALAYNPDNDHVLNNYSYFLSLRKEKLDLAKKMSTKLVMRNPENATYLDTHAWVLFMKGEYKDAKIYIEKAVNSNDELSGTIIEHYGDILFKLGDVDSAVKQWQKAKGMDETSELIDKKIADRKLYEP